jgi:hypothetical protein
MLRRDAVPNKGDDSPLSTPYFVPHPNQSQKRSFPRVGMGHHGAGSGPASISTTSSRGGTTGGLQAGHAASQGARLQLAHDATVHPGRASDRGAVDRLGGRRVSTVPLPARCLPSLEVLAVTYEKSGLIVITAAPDEEATLGLADRCGRTTLRRDERRSPAPGPGRARPPSVVTRILPGHGLLTDDDPNGESGEHWGLLKSQA